MIEPSADLKVEDDRIRMAPDPVVQVGTDYQILARRILDSGILFGKTSAPCQRAEIYLVQDLLKYLVSFPLHTTRPRDILLAYLPVMRGLVPECRSAHGRDFAWRRANACKAHWALAPRRNVLGG
jgi:hypothetical protein